MTEVSLQGGWGWRGGEVVPAEHLGRRCLRFADPERFIYPAPGLELRDGTLELDLAMTAERCFPGLAWRLRDGTYEMFFVRPHQSGNPDSIQYTPAFHGVSAWQLYHGPGYWSPVELPIGRWFTLRVSFAGTRGEAFIDDMTTPVLAFECLVPPVVGGVGILPGGPEVHVARFAVDRATPVLGPVPPPRAEAAPGTIRGWWVSEPVAEGSPPSKAGGWTFLEAEPSGLVNFARLHPLEDGRDTVFARVSLRASDAGSRLLEVGFSDRAVVYLNGRPLFRGDETYRSRDYRFLGSIGYFHGLHLPLEAGDNELVVAVSESFGGWGLMARLPDGNVITLPGDVS
jgi:hypothetical protein